MLENSLNWCRLCAKRESENAEEKTYKVESITDHLEIVNKYFMISLLPYHELQLLICEDCSNFLAKVDGYRNVCTKVDQMYNELFLSKNFSNENLQAIRLKFGVDHEDIKFIAHQSPEEVESNVVSVKAGDPLEDDIDYDDTVVVKEEESEGRRETIPRRRGRQRRSTRLQLPRSTKKGDKLKRLKIEKLDEEESGEECKESPAYEPNQSADDTSAPKKRQKALVSEKKEHFCEICNKKFCRSNVLKDHIIAQHRKEELPFVCSICSKRFLTAYKLKLHEDTHRPDDERRIYPCSYCGKKFAKTVQVQAHINAVHIRNKPYICEECGKGFGTKGALVEHQISHTEDRPFQCSFCPKKFKNRIQVKNHEEIHKDPVYSCPHCDQKFRTRLILRMHMVVHSDVKQYKCNYCGNEYKRAKTLKNHLILHTGLRPYSCPFCDKTFSNGSNCRSHKKKAHPVELAALEASGQQQTKTSTPKLEHLQPKQTVPML